MNIIYKPYVLINSTGNTTDYSIVSSAITSGIFIPSGVTLNITEFDKNIINRIDIINNIINYVSDGINKYMLNLLIVSNSGETSGVTQTGQYCIQISYNSEVLDYLIMSIGNTLILSNSGTTITSGSISSDIINFDFPIIYYNSGTSWIGSGITIPYNVFLNLGIVWTLDNLKTLFIDKVVDCFDGSIALSSVTFLLFNNVSLIPITGITKPGIYNIYISYTDNSGNNITNYITNIIVDDEPPIIIYKPYVISYMLTGNTNLYSGASSAITSNIYISSGFTLNVGGFDHNYIDRLDIINNIVNYAYDNIDIDLNKYKIEVLIAGSHNDYGAIVYTGVTQPGLYCVKILLTDSSGNEVIDYFIMKVVYDVSIYSEGYWQDNKVWVDFVLWLDHPIIPER